MMQKSHLKQVLNVIFDQFEEGESVLNLGERPTFRVNLKAK